MLTIRPRHASYVLAMLLPFILLACGGVAAAADPPPMPEPAEGEQLPRSYVGWQLGESAPANAKRVADHPSYPEAQVFSEKLSEKPLIFRRALVHEGTIFRIEWKSENAALDLETLSQAFEERLGPRMEMPFGAKTNSVWSDGLTHGKTSWTIFSRSGSDWLTIGVQDEGRNLELLTIGR